MTYELPPFFVCVCVFVCMFAMMFQDGTEVNDVQLPPWARGPADFIQKHRAALEVKSSNYWFILVQLIQLFSPRWSLRQTKTIEK